MASGSRSVRDWDGGRGDSRYAFGTVDMDSIKQEMEIICVMDNKRLRQELKEKEEQLQGMRAEMDKLAEQLVAMALGKSDRGRRRNTEEKLRRELKESKKLNEVTAREAKEEGERVRKMIKEKDDELQRMRGMIADQSDRLRELEEDDGWKWRELESASEELEGARNELKSAQEDLGVVQKELEQTKKDHKKAVQSLNQMAASRKTKGEEYQKTMASKEKELEDARKQLAGAEEELQNVRKQVAEKEELRVKAEQKSTEIMEVLKRKDEALEEMRSAMAREREEEVTILKRELEVALQGRGAEKFRRRYGVSRSGRAVLISGDSASSNYDTSAVEGGAHDSISSEPKSGRSMPEKHKLSQDDTQPPRKAKGARLRSSAQGSSPGSEESNANADRDDVAGDEDGESSNLDCVGGVAGVEPEPGQDATPPEDEEAPNGNRSIEVVVMASSSRNCNEEELQRQVKAECFSPMDPSRKPKLGTEAGSSSRKSLEGPVPPIPCITIDSDSDSEDEQELTPPQQAPVNAATGIASTSGQASEDVIDSDFSMETQDQASKSKRLPPTQARIPRGESHIMQKKNVSAPPSSEDEDPNRDRSPDVEEDAVEVVLIVPASDVTQQGNSDADAQGGSTTTTTASGPPNEPAETSSSSDDDPRDPGSVDQEEADPLETTGPDPEIDTKFTLTRNVVRRQRTKNGRATTPRRIPVALMRHLHHGKNKAKPLFCLCGNPYPSRHALAEHIYRFKGKPRRCDICNKFYSSLLCLNRHKERIHSNPRRQTPTAGPVFRRRSEEIVEISRTKKDSHGFLEIRAGPEVLSSHPVPGPSSSSSSSGGVQYFCKCGQQFPSNDSFLEHMKGIKLEGEFKCIWCPVGLNSRLGMILHQKKYHPMQFLQNELRQVSSSME